ncbi:MAG: ATP-dependent DNA helicase RecG, partial [Gammaproteobacteria bacterium]|nr:ATP-dependent DNA helicase RecG [Gammaproteobacteria bacterium]
MRSVAPQPVAHSLRGDTPVRYLRGVGPQLADKLARLEVRTLSDVLFHLPLRYQDRSRVTPIGALRAGQPAMIEGVVELADTVIRRRRVLLVHVSDGSGAVTLRFFHFRQSQAEAFARGVHLRCYGEVRTGTAGLEMVHPEYRILKESGAPPEETALTPIYPATEGIGQAKLRALAGQALQWLSDDPALLPDLLPEEFLRQAHLPGLSAALCYVHRPPIDAPVAALMDGSHPAQQRLAFEELLAHHLSLRQLRQKADRSCAPVIAGASALAKKFLTALAFRLTGAQQRVAREILQDLSRPHPMMRLVQGDVG